MKLGGSIEGKHGMDEPDHEPSGERESLGARMEATGATLQSAGNQMSSCGGSLVRLGCFGFLALMALIFVIALLSGGSSSSPPSTSSGEPVKTIANTRQRPNRALGKLLKNGTVNTAKPRCVSRKARKNPTKPNRRTAKPRKRKQQPKTKQSAKGSG